MRSPTPSSAPPISKATDGGAKIVEGNRKVLAARLSDARFFYDTDLKTPLEEQAAKLSNIVFHEKLGTVADKVDRVAKLARWLVEEGIIQSPSPLVGEGRGPLASASGKGEGDAATVAPQTPLSPFRAYGGAPSLSHRGRGDRPSPTWPNARAPRQGGPRHGMVGEFPNSRG